MGVSRFVLPLLAAAISTGAQDPNILPLVQKSDVEYLGSFALPTTQSGTSRFGYGGRAIIPFPHHGFRRLLQG